MKLKEAEFVWMNGKFVKWEEAKVPILTHALHYGTGVFEGIRAYPSDGNLYVFRLRDHMRRLLESAKVYFIETSYTVDELSEAALELLRRNKLRELSYIRPIIFVGYGGIGLNFTGFPVHVAIYALPFGKYFDKPFVKVKVSTWRRISESATPPLAKASGNYLNSVLAKLEALKDGYDDAILLDQQGYLSEGTGENIFIVKDDILMTPPLSSSILKGITRDTVIQMAKDLSIDVKEKPITRTELYLCDEAFFTGTAAEITPIVEVDKRTIGNGKPGRITLLLKDLYTEIVHAKNEKYLHWLTSVY